MIYLFLVFAFISLSIMYFILGFFAYRAEVLDYDHFGKLPINLGIIVTIALSIIFINSFMYSMVEIDTMQKKITYYENKLEPNQHWQYNQEEGDK